ncbi:MAG: fibrobacter succinogenes major paralogous domain-containing protein, partial [Flavobacteriales bacterium]|nr:fibrobacter succinogenes major paralogous domain-containing protein [Flavobacteriales bacterium]
SYNHLLIVFFLTSALTYQRLGAQYPLTVTDADGNEYPTVRIGNQIWMKENLRATHYLTGEPITQIQLKEDWRNTKEGAWCNYQNDTALAKQYGRLYNYQAVYNWRGICPWGWHIPSLYEWEQLIRYLEGESVAGVKMKAVGKWKNLKQPVIGAVAFQALPAGFRNAMGYFDNLGSNASFWSATLRETNLAWFFIINQDDNRLLKVSGDINYGMSCRCVKD